MEAVVREAILFARELGLRFEIIVVDDGSRDRTSEIVERLATSRPEVRLVRNATNEGYGSALARGFGAASMPWVFYTDGDGQFDLRDLRDALSWLETHDVVCGYRGRRQDGWVRRANGRGWTWLTNTLLGLRLRDVNCAFKIFPRALFDAVELRSRGAFIDAEIMAHVRRRGLRVAEHRVRHRARRAGKPSGARLRVVLRAIGELVSFMVRRESRSIARASLALPQPRPSLSEPSEASGSHDEVRRPGAIVVVRPRRTGTG